MSTITADNGQKPWLVVGSAVVSSILLLASACISLFGAASYNDSYSHAADKAWGVLGIVSGGLLFVASCLALLFVVVRKTSMRSVAIAFLGLAILSHVVLAAAGISAMADAKRRGGDWGALAVLGSLIFEIAIPCMIGLLAVADSFLLFRLRRDLERQSSGH